MSTRHHVGARPRHRPGLGTTDRRRPASRCPTPPSWPTPTGLIVAANPGAESMFGYPPGALTGDRTSTSSSPIGSATTTPGSAPPMSPIPPRGPWARGPELWAKRLDRTEFPADISLAPLGAPERAAHPGGGAGPDRATAPSGRPSAWLAAIVSSSEDAIVSMDLGGTLTTWNPGAERLLGYSADEICGKPVSRLVPDDLRADVEEQMARVRGGMHIPTRDTVRLHKNGQRDRGGRGALAHSRAHRCRHGDLGGAAGHHGTASRPNASCGASWSTDSGASAGSGRSPRSGCRCSAAAGSTQWLALIARRASELSDADGITVSVVAAERRLPSGGDRHPRGRRWRRCGARLVPDRRLRRGTGLHLGPLDGHRPIPRRCSSSTEPTPSPPGSARCSSSRSPRRTGTTGCSAWSGWSGRAGFSPEEIRVVESFGQQAGLAIELDRAQNDREQLAVMGDRERIARDLHDHVVQRLFAVGMALQAASRSITDPPPSIASASPSRSSTPPSATCGRPSSRWRCAPRPGRDEHPGAPSRRDLDGGPGTRVPTPAAIRRSRGHEGPRGARPRRAGRRARGASPTRPVTPRRRASRSASMSTTT